MKKIICCLLIFLLACPLFVSCDRDAYDSPVSGKGFFSTALIWEDKFDSTDEIQKVNLWIFTHDGKLAVEKSYNNPNELALDKYELVQGLCNVIVGVNITEPIEDIHKSTPEDLVHELERQAALYEETYCGSKTAEVVNGESRAAYVPLDDKQREESPTGTLDIRNIPDYIQKVEYCLLDKNSGFTEYTGEIKTVKLPDETSTSFMIYLRLTYKNGQKTEFSTTVDAVIEDDNRVLAVNFDEFTGE